MQSNTTEYKHIIMTAVDMAEKQLVDTHNTVSEICSDVADALVTEEYPYVSRFDIRHMFKVKHGMGMAKFREAQTGVTNAEVVKQRNKENKAEGIELAKRLLTNTYLSIGDVGRLSGLGRGSAISGIFKRFGLPTPTQYRRHNRARISVYAGQVMNRKRIHLNGGARLVQRYDGTRTAVVNLAKHLPSGEALVSVTIQSFSFNLAGFIAEQRLACVRAVVLQTPFLANVPDEVEKTVTFTLLSGAFYPVTLKYDFHKQELSIINQEHSLSQIEMTVQLVTTPI